MMHTVVLEQYNAFCLVHNALQIKLLNACLDL